MSVQSGSFTPRFMATDAAARGGTGLELYGAYAVNTLVVGTETYVYATGSLDFGMSVFRLGQDSFDEDAVSYDSQHLDGSTFLPSAL